MIRIDDKDYKTLRVNIDEILVTKEFKEHQPHRDKIDDAIAFYEANGYLDKPIVLNRNFYIKDGYSRYLAAKMLGIRELQVLIETKPAKCYIFGIHPEDPKQKERVWQVPRNKEFGENWAANILPGDEIIVKTCHGDAPIIVTKIEWLEDRPRKERIRSVCLNGKIWN